MNTKPTAAEKQLWQRLNKNKGGYFGEVIEVQAVLRDIEAIAQEQGWTSEIFHQQGGFKYLALRRAPLSSAQSPLRVYVSTGMHGDEPAGPLAGLRLLRENRWPAHLDLWFCPCLNPAGLALNRRENAEGKDMNRDYRSLETAEVRAHIAWLEKQPHFDLCLCLHEDWESNGFYVYELNQDQRPSLAEAIVETVAQVCPIDTSEIIEGRAAKAGIIRPDFDLQTRPLWAEAFWLAVNRTRLSYTLEAPSDFSLATRVDALVAGTNTALERI